MYKTIVHHEGAAALTAAGHYTKTRPATVKLGVDIHSQFYVVAAQYDYAAIKPPRRFAPESSAWARPLVSESRSSLLHAPELPRLLQRPPFPQ